MDFASFSELASTLFFWVQDREIDELNEIVDEDGKVLEHLEIQLLDERRKRADVERENTMLREQINMLMNMLQEDEGDEAPDEP